jgi:hypothetical protein
MVGPVTRNRLSDRDATVVHQGSQGANVVDQYFKDLLEASSLGTPAARAIRASTPSDIVDDVRRRRLERTHTVDRAEPTFACSQAPRDAAEGMPIAAEEASLMTDAAFPLCRELTSLAPQRRQTHPVAAAADKRTALSFALSPWTPKIQTEPSALPSGQPHRTNTRPQEDHVSSLAYAWTDLQTEYFVIVDCTPSTATVAPHDTGVLPTTTSTPSSEPATLAFIAYSCHDELNEMVRNHLKRELDYLRHELDAVDATYDHWLQIKTTSLLDCETPTTLPGSRHYHRSAIARQRAWRSHLYQASYDEDLRCWEHFRRHTHGYESGRSALLSEARLEQHARNAMRWLKKAQASFSVPRAYDVATFRISKDYGLLDARPRVHRGSRRMQEANRPSEQRTDRARWSDWLARKHELLDEISRRSTPAALTQCLMWPGWVWGSQHSYQEDDGLLCWSPRRQDAEPLSVRQESTEASHESQRLPDLYFQHDPLLLELGFLLGQPRRDRLRGVPVEGVAPTVVAAGSAGISMPNSDGLRPLSKPIATALTTGIGSAAGAVVALHVGHPTAGSATTATVAGALALFGGADAAARAFAPLTSTCRPSGAAKP